MSDSIVQKRGRGRPRIHPETPKEQPKDKPKDKPKDRSKRPVGRPRKNDTTIITQDDVTHNLRSILKTSTPSSQFVKPNFTIPMTTPTSTIKRFSKFRFNLNQSNVSQNCQSNGTQNGSQNVDVIQGKRIIGNGKVEYLVKWDSQSGTGTGTGESLMEWLPEELLNQELVAIYELKNNSFQAHGNSSANDTMTIRLTDSFLSTQINPFKFALIFIIIAIASVFLFHFIKENYFSFS